MYKCELQRDEKANESVERSIYPRFGPFGTKSGKATPRNITIPQRIVKAITGIADAPIFFLFDHVLPKSSERTRSRWPYRVRLIYRRWGKGSHERISIHV